MSNQPIGQQDRDCKNMPITRIKSTNISNTGVYGISSGTDATQNASINAAFLAANNAANTANTDYTTISIAAGSYGNSNYTPIVNVAANGRVTGISTVATAGSGGGSANNWYSANGYFINSNTITSNITVTSGNNALSIGPITVNNNVTTLVQSASRWIIL